MQRFGREVRGTLIALGLYLGTLAFLAIVAVKFVPPLLKEAAAKPFTWGEVVGVADDRDFSANRLERAVLPLHGTIAEPELSRRREPHSLPN
jgi:hypothetical protein